MSLSIDERQLIELRIRNDAPNIVVAYVLWGFLGLLSAHRFYLGRPWSAILQILSWLTVIGGLVWWLFDAAMISAYIRDDKAALRVRLVSEMEGERRDAAPPPRQRIVDTQPPVAAPTKAPMPVAAAMSAEPAKPAADQDLVLVSRDEQPLVLDTTRPAKVVIAPLSFAKTDERAEAAAAATLALSEPEPPHVAVEPEPEVKTVSIPHPEAVDSSPIEVFPPQPAAEPPTKADEWKAAEPLKIDLGS